MATLTTMRGKAFDMGAFKARHGHQRAIGNSNMNARGDLIDETGKVIKAREVIMAEYNRNNPKAVRAVSIKDLASEVLPSPAEVVAQVTAAKTAATPIVEEPKKRKLSDID